MHILNVTKIPNISSQDNMNEVNFSGVLCAATSNMTQVQIKGMRQ